MVFSLQPKDISYLINAVIQRTNKARRQTKIVPTVNLIQDSKGFKDNNNIFLTTQITMIEL